MDGSSNGLDFDDIDDFAAALEGAGVPNALAAIERALAGVPEPGAAHMLVAAIWGLIAGHRRRRSR